VMNARTVAPFLLETVWTQPRGRNPTFPALTVPNSSPMAPSMTMARQLCAGLDPGHECSPLGVGVPPKLL
jgi:hypothetical protein